MPEARLSVSARGVPLPLEIRDADFRLVATALTDQPLELPAGAYVVAAQPPGEERMLETVTLGPGEDRTLIMEPPRKVRPRVDASRAVPSWRLRMLTPGGSHPSTSVVRAVDEADGVVELQVRVPDQVVTFAQLRRPGEVPINVALPGDSRLIIGTSEHGLRATGLPSVDRSGLALRFLVAGQARQGARLVSGEEAEAMLAGKMRDPIGAAIGAYLLLRLGDLDRLHEWPETLADRFEWLPDGAVIAGEVAALRGRHGLALSRFVEAAGRGLPVLTEGFSILLHRVRRFSAREDLEGSVGEKAAASARGLLRRMQDWPPFVEFGAPTLTFRAGDPSDPRGSQAPDQADVGPEDWVFARDDEGRLTMQREKGD